MTYWEKLTALAAPYPALRPQLTAMAAVREALAEPRLPENALPPLGLAPDLFADLLAAHPDAYGQLVAVDHLLRNFRRACAFEYGMWAFVHEALFTQWQALFGPLRYLELAAGNGYVSAGLAAQGNRVIATDSFAWKQESETGRTPLLPVEALPAAAALHRYGDQVDAVVMAWSPDRDPNDVHVLQVLRAYFPHLKFFVIGERFGATDSRLFWQLAEFVPDKRLLALNRALGRFDAVNERIYLMR
ncbi:SAM-dependent methyltransferase [Lacticaseibacillus mingshuiensis]|uniref:SAM-dependent methyltransferase n=1 Tax=Lacticaseibacillus mingshuiensis TaxID=2799574 RepID=UPI0019502CA9|nr:SAM-dependent methyltransferase [Lacticaseibacillus mingshuiensis]